MSQQNNFVSSQEKVKLEFWGLPKNILKNYEQCGITNMFPWQVECLSCEGVLSGKNLVYSAPTSAGKTMVAEMLTIKTVLERKKKVIFILPFVSVVREKMIYFQTLLSSSWIKVAGFMGSHAPHGGMKSVHIGVCTIEKANSLINRMLEDQGLENIGCIVVDELHMLGDPHRGYLLELLLTKIKYICQKDSSLSIQIIGMSATLPNLNELANWLNAALYTTNFRPVPLQEYLKIDLKIINASNLSVKCTLQPSIQIQNDKGNVTYLCLETLLSGHSVLVFCHTRSWCESSALQIAHSIQRLGNEKSDTGIKLRNQLNSTEIFELLQQLKNCPAGLDSTLGNCVSFGVAFHHAGLTIEERDIIEGAFRNSIVRVLVATTTLSSGVNLPARRVLIRCPTGGRDLDILSYRQMVGRAGRMGKDSAGESFLICSASEEHIGKELITSNLPPVKSCLGLGNLSASLKRAILEVVASGVVCSMSEVDQYTNCTLFSSIGCSKRESDLLDPISNVVEFLQTNEFIRIDNNSLGPTPLAEACLSASLPPDQGLKLLKELHRARQCFVLETELHVIYQVAPYSVSEQWSQIDWLNVFNIWEELPISMKRVGELVGIEERFLVRAMRGTINMKSLAQTQLLSVHRRFYTALALQDLVNEVPLPEVAAKFKCSKGLLQSLQQSASTFAGMVTQFSRRLGWSNVELLVSQFCARLQFGVHRELLDLLRLDCLSPILARGLYNAGITGLPDLAVTSATKIEKALMKAVPFVSNNEKLTEEANGKKQRRLWLVGRHAATEAEAATILIHEARLLLETELGLVGAQWDITTTTCSYTSSCSKSQCSSIGSSLSSPTQVLHSPFQLIGKLVTDQENISYNEPKISKQNCNNSNRSISIERSVCLKDNAQCLTNPNTSAKNDLNSFAEHEMHNNAVNETIDHVDSPNGETSKANVNVVDCKSNGKNIERNIKLSKHESISEFPNIPQLNSSLTDVQQTNKVKKRGSLDLFESPNSSHNNDKENQTNGNTDHFKTNSSIQEVEKQDLLNDDKLRNSVLLNYSNMNKYSNVYDANSNLNISHSDMNNLVSTHSKSEKEEVFDFSKNSVLNSTFNVDVLNLSREISGNSLLKHGDTFFNEICFNTPRNTKEDIEFKKNRSSLDMFDSPDDCEYLEKLNNVDKVFEPKNHDDIDENAFDSNIGGDGILEMSSRLIEKFVRKRKRDSSFEEKDFKRFKESITDEVSSIKNECKISGSEVKCQDIKIDEEKIIEIIDSSWEMVENTENKSLFKSSLNINTQINKLLEENNKQEIDQNIDKVDTQVELNNLNLSNIAFDEDIVFGTPEPKTMYQSTFRKYSTFKNNTNNNFSKSKLNSNDFVCEKQEISHSEVTKLKSSLGGSLSSEVKLLCLHPKRKRTDEKEVEILCDGDTSGVKRSKCKHELDTFDDYPVKKSEVKDGTEKRYLAVSKEITEIICVSLKQTNSEKEFPNKKLKDDKLENNENELYLHSDIVNEFDNEFHEISPKEAMIHGNTSSREILEKTVHITNTNNDNMIMTEPVTNDNLKTRAESFRNVFLTKRMNNKYYNESNSTGNTSNNATKHSVPEDAFKSTFLHNELLKNIMENQAVTKHSEKRPLEDEELLEEDYIPSSQEINDTPVKSLHKYSRRQNPESPNQFTNPSNKKVLNLLEINELNQRQFEEDILKQKELALALDIHVRTGISLENGGIGSKILKNKTEDNNSKFHHKENALLGFVITWGGIMYYFDLLKNATTNIQILNNIIKNEAIIIIAWDWKQTVKTIYQCCQISVLAQGRDLSVAEWLLNPESGFSSLKQLAKKYEIKIPTCSNELQLEAALLWDAHRKLKKKLKQAELYKSYIGIEMPVQSILASMELSGMAWNISYANSLWSSVELKMTELQELAYFISDKQFNLGSRRDVTKVKTTLKRANNDEEPQLFLEVLKKWQKLRFLKTNNLSPLLLLGEGRLHGKCYTHTATGRISIFDPNLQNIPRDIYIDDDVISLRSAFTTNPGNILIAADFCQLELRILAHLSQDKYLLQKLNSPGDIFASIAADWNKIGPDKVTDGIRQQTKQLCYGIIYGMGYKSLAKEMEVSEEQAEEMSKKFKETYPGLQKYINKCIEICKSKGYVTTLMGRRRFLPEINSKNKRLRVQAERQAVNSTIQGSAADIAKVAMIKIEKALNSIQNRDIVITSSCTAHLVLQLHDELIYEVNQDISSQVIDIIRQKMEECIKLSVTLPVKIKMGSSWGKLEVKL